MVVSFGVIVRHPIGERPDDIGRWGRVARWTRV
jgi:hypothetical protein